MSNAVRAFCTAISQIRRALSWIAEIRTGIKASNGHCHNIKPGLLIVGNDTSNQIPDTEVKLP